MFGVYSVSKAPRSEGGGEYGIDQSISNVDSPVSGQRQGCRCLCLANGFWFRAPKFLAVAVLEIAHFVSIPSFSQRQEWELLAP